MEWDREWLPELRRKAYVKGAPSAMVPALESGEPLPAPRR
jgi:hypothetical protein